MLRVIPGVPTFIVNTFSVYPHCTLTDTFNTLNIARRNNFVSIKYEKIFLAEQSIFSWNGGISRYLVTMLSVGIVAFIILLIIEKGVIRMIKQVIFPHIKRRYPNDNSIIDDDVLNEKVRIDSMSPAELKSETLAMQNVSKFYGSLCAVNKTSIVIKR